jgi:hypothetical protein
MTLEDAMNYKRYAITVFGKTYNNGLVDIAKEYEISVRSLYSRVYKGMSVEEAIKADYSMKNAIEFEGRLYKSKKKLAEAYDIEYTKFMKRLETHNIHDAIYNVNQIEERKVVYNKIEYNNLVELCNELDISIYAVKNSLKGKERTEDSIIKAVNKALVNKEKSKQKIKIFDKEYDSIYKAGLDYGLKTSALDSRKNKVTGVLEIIGLKGRFLRLRVGETIKNVKIENYMYKGRDNLDYYSCINLIDNNEIILNENNFYEYVLSTLKL